MRTLPLLAIFGTFGASLSADVIYTNLDPGGLFDTTAFHEFGWSDEQRLSRAFSFTPDADYNLTSITVALSQQTIIQNAPRAQFSEFPEGLNAFLYVDNDGEPLTEFSLESFTLPALTSSPALFTLVSETQPLLEAGFSYWIELVSTDLIDGIDTFRWYKSNNIEPEPMATGFWQDGEFQGYGLTFTRAGAFAVEGVAIPEPLTTALGIAFLALSMAVWRRPAR